MYKNIKTLQGLPIGCDDYGKVVEGRYAFVDKSLLIQEILADSSEVLLITRPRRFGKTLNMSLLQHFFASQVMDRKTEGMFAHLKIAQFPECMAHQGQYPVMSLTFKDVKGDTYQKFYHKLSTTISNLYLRHAELLSSAKLRAAHKKRIEAFIDYAADEHMLESSLAELTSYLYQSSGVQPILLIDEYDAPIQAGYQYGYYDKAVQLMQGVLSPALKNNPYLKKAVLTGVLRVSKEGMFSGLNNVAVYSVMDPEYSEYFGFTEAEVEQLLQQAGLLDKQAEVRQWYNGYYMGNRRMYNPWSIINYLQRGGRCAAYWLNSSDNVWLKELLIQSDVKVKATLYQLLEGKSVQVPILDNFVFADLKQNTSSLWNLLVMAGYLTVTESTLVDPELLSCRIEIPNYEVRAIYLQFIRQWLSGNRGPEWYQEFIEHLLTGNIQAWADDIKEVILQMTSYHDSALAPEAFYHGMLLGICSPLQGYEYLVKSNQESGTGRYDIALIPHDRKKLGIIIELKHAAIGKQASLEEIETALAAAAKAAFAQMQENDYAAGLRQAGIANICQIAVAFHGKLLHIQHGMGTIFS